jgi:hypothetical protein
MKYSISFAGLEVQGGRIAVGFRVDRPDAALVCVVARAPVSRALTLFPSEGGKLDEPAFALAVGQWALPQIEAGLADGTYELLAEADRGQSAPLDVSGVELEAIASAVSEKRCRYQAPVAGDLFCDAGLVDQNPSSDLAKLSGHPTSVRAKFPTSVFLCGTCTLPDDRIICSRLHHAVVQRADRPTESSMFALHADCDLGRREASPPAQCHFLGHECWRREIETAPRRDGAAMSALAIHESIDYFGAVWLNAFKVPLVRLSMVAPGGVLATTCNGHQDFQAKLTALGEVFNSFQVQYADPALSGSLALMRAKLKTWGAEKGAAPEDIASMERAMEVLQKTLGLRAGQQHGPARGRLESAIRYLGLSLPPPSYSQAWNSLQAALHDALGELRRFIREHV